ncbi:MAG: DUF1156 domain-containing protein, partial [Infirmifilum sp.]
IPEESLPPYGSRGMGGDLKTVIWGLDKWYKHFNPRQLLTLVKLVKLVREAGKKVEEEKLAEGWDKEKAVKYAEAITTYLAIALCKHTDWNSIVSGWQLSYLIAAHTLATGGIAMIWNWGEYNPLSDYRGTIKAMLKGTIEGLSYLVSAVSSSPSRVRVVLDDATELSKLEGERFDLIVTDPPYRDDVPYTELSDFYYVWLKRALSDVKGGRLAPRFLSDAFFRRVGDAYREVKTQWEELAMREVGLNPGRISFFRGKKVNGEEARQYFIELLHRSFLAMRERLADGGILATYYAHTDPEAWEELISAGWRAGFRVAAAFPVVTESAQRVTARGKAALDTSIVVVWRPGVSGEALADEVYREALKAAEERALELMRTGWGGVDLFVGVLSAALAPATSRVRIVGVKDVGFFVREKIYPATVRALARAVAQVVGGRAAGAEVRSPEAVFYLLAKLLLPRSARVGVRLMDRSTVHILGFGTGLDDERLVAAFIVAKSGENFRLLEPSAAERDALVELLRARRLDPARPVLRGPVDVLHLLEYHALVLDVKGFKEQYERLRSLNAFYVDEAVRLAEVFAGERILPPADPERELCRRVVSYLFGRGTLEGWLHGA